MLADKEIILTCEHASSYIPSEYNNLGLSQAELNMHIAYDKGCKEVTEKLAKELGCKYILGECSRLFVDINRRQTEDDLILSSSDGIVIKGNQNVDAKERQNRIEMFYKPYHSKIAEMVTSCKKEPFVFSIHSYTNKLMTSNTPRPWHAGLLYFEEDKIINNMLKSLDATGLNIGRNQPYDIRSYNTGTAAIHGQDKGISNAIIEIRDDEFSDFEKGVDKWVAILENVLK
ncbi:MAG: N-formylglutamate amidohydrolase [Alphaproteobacteria bacterium]